MHNVVTDYIKNLNANDRFYLPGSTTMYVVDSRRTEGNVTRINYRIPTEAGMRDYLGTVTKVNLSTVYRIED